MSAKYNRIGKNYNQTRKADPYLAIRMIHHLQPQTGKNYLDIGCGTGNYTHKISQAGGVFMGVDPSQRMLDAARERHPQIKWQLGTAENLPMEDESVDGVIASLTLHHWEDLEKGFKELQRVLKPEGKIVIFTSTPEQMEGYWRNQYFPQMMKDSCHQMPTEEDVRSAALKGGFALQKREIYEIRPDLQDGFLYVGKHEPQRYLDPQLRKGISSFSALAHQEEVKQGLQDLQKDIESGAIRNVMASFDHQKGDYLFIIAKKS